MSTNKKGPEPVNSVAKLERDPRKPGGGLLGNRMGLRGMLTGCKRQTEERSHFPWMTICTRHKCLGRK